MASWVLKDPGNCVGKGIGLSQGEGAEEPPSPQDKADGN